MGGKRMKLKMDLNKLENGTYFIEYKYDGKMLDKRKIIKI